MKKKLSLKNRYGNVFLMTFILAGAMVFSGCGGEGTNEPTPEEQQKTKLSVTWTLSSVTFGGVEDRTADWSGFSLTFTSAGSYSTSGVFSPGPWPASGSWSFVTDASGNVNINKVIRNDGLEITVSVSETDLTMTFVYDDTVHSGGRTEAVNGEYVFKMKK